MKKQIAILGSTGSIGTQALQVIEEHADQYEPYVLTANSQVEKLIAQARRYQPEAVVIADESKYATLKEAFADLPIKVYAGEEALAQIVTESPIDNMETFLIKALQLMASLSLLVFIHELGHFLFARLFKTKVEKFYLFFNPWFSLCKYTSKRSGTEYGIGRLPLGGYTKIAGMIDESMDTERYCLSLG